MVLSYCDVAWKRTQGPIEDKSIKWVSRNLTQLENRTQLAEFHTWWAAHWSWFGVATCTHKNQGVWWAQQLQLTLTGGKLLPLNEIFRFRRPIAILRWPSITAALAILSALFNHFLIKCQVSFFWNIFTLSTCLAAFGTKMIDTLQNSPQLSSTKIWWKSFHRHFGHNRGSGQSCLRTMRIAARYEIRRSTLNSQGTLPHAVSVGTNED